MRLKLWCIIMFTTISVLIILVSTLVLIAKCELHQLLMLGILVLITVGTTVGSNSHTTVSTPGGYQRFPVNFEEAVF